jgi:type IV pilus assembly protein PilV
MTQSLHLEFAGSRTHACVLESGGSRTRTCAPARAHTRSRGFSLIEVLVALIIIAVGMLGLAKIQALAYANTGVASQQSIAALQAASLASAMRANRNYWAAVATTTVAFSYTASVVAGTATVVSSDATLLNPYVCTSGGADAPCLLPAKLAAYDVQAWVTGINGIKNVLPNPTATITCPVVPTAATPVGCWIKLTWTEENVAMNTSTAMTQPTYFLYVVP